MTTFTVDPGSLRSLAGRLGGLCSQLGGMQDVVTGYDGLLGGRALESEVQHFCGNWHYGIGLLEQHMQHVIENLSKAGATYAASEKHIVDACPT